MTKERILYRNVQLLLIGLIGFLLISCAHNGTSENNIEEVTLISELEYVQYFRSGALEHVLEGELNKKGEAVGFHYDQLPTKKGEVIEGTKTATNEFGAYEAEVIVKDVAKKSNEGKSTFFPDEWDTQQVIEAINEAYENRELITGNTYEGLTMEGMVIRMYLDQEEKIISAFPIY